MPTPEPRDDGAHAPERDPRWRESYYFSFYDERAGIGGFSSIGRRAARGHSGSVNCLWWPGRPTLIASERDSYTVHDDEQVAAGLRYERERPFGAWRLRFDGELNDGGDGVACADRALGPVARSDAPAVAVRYDLRFEPHHAPYLYTERPEWRTLFDGHVDEVGTVRGWIELDGERIAIDGRGAKDHSWGVRDWFGTDAWRWIDLVRESGPELVTWRSCVDGTWTQDGAIYAAGETLALERYEERIETIARAGKPRPDRIELRAVAGAHELAFSGEILRVVPLRFEGTVDGAPRTCWIDRTLVRVTSPDGEVGWANVEFSSQVTSTEAGAPAT